MLRLTLFSALVASALAAPVAAKGVFYACDMKVSRADGWVSPKVGFVFDGNGGVQVIDSVTLHFLGEPVPARANKRANKARIKWNIAAAEDSKGQRVPTFSYIARLDLETLAVSLVAKPVGFPQRFSGKGTCVIQKNAKIFLRR